jgi:hypothetical protein
MSGGYIEKPVGSPGGAFLAHDLFTALTNRNGKMHAFTVLGRRAFVHRVPTISDTR